MVSSAGLPWRVRPGTLVIENVVGVEVASVRCGQWRREATASQVRSREEAEVLAAYIVACVNACGSNHETSGKE